MKILLPFILLSACLARDEEAFASLRAEWCGSRNCYDVLGVAPESNYATIKEAFRKLSKELHPDKCPECDPAEMTAVNNAYGILSNPINRQMYDRVLKVKREVDAPRENPVLVLTGVFLLISYITSVYQIARFKEAKKGAINIPKIRRVLMDRSPESFPKQLTRSEKRKLKGKAEAPEVDPIEAVPNALLDEVLTQFKIPVKGWTGTGPTFVSAMVDTIMFPVTLVQWIIFQSSWQIRYRLLGQEMTRGDKLLLLLEKHDLDQRGWDMMSWENKASYLTKPGEWTDLYDELKEEYTSSAKDK